jgi:hypothetical protein
MPIYVKRFCNRIGRFPFGSSPSDLMTQFGGELRPADYRGEAVPFDKEEFFKKQIEECRELESQAVSAEDRAFWRQAVGRWEEQLRQAQRGKF